MSDRKTSFEQQPADWLSVKEALGRLRAAAVPLPVEEVALEQARGQALALPLEARATLPPWDNSAMDGYAVRSSDIAGAATESPVSLEVVGENRPGGVWDGTLGAGEALRIMTGAAVPAGADTVVRVEDTDAEATPGVVQVASDRDSGRHIRPAGQDMRAGGFTLPPGTTLTPGALAVAAALGHPRIRVHRRPTVALMSSGDELRTPDRFDDVMAGRGIPETNSVAIAAGIAAIGGQVARLGIALDREDDIRERVARALDADVLVTTGGASMGEADLFKRVLQDAGLTIDFWRVRMRPGSPISLGHLPRPPRAPLPVLGLPGNPASAFVTFQIFVRPFLLRLAGHSRIHRRVVLGRVAERLPSTPRLTQFHRVVMRGHGPTAEVKLSGPTSSGLVRGLAFAEGLAVVPEGVSALEIGDPVEVVLLDDGAGAIESAGYAEEG